MIKKFYLFMIALIAIFQIIYSQDYKINLTEKSCFYEERIKDTLKFISVNQSFDLAHNEKYGYIILSQNFKRTQLSEWDYQISYATIKAYINKNGKYENIWEISGDYDTGKYNYQDLYILIKYGYGVPSEQTYYNIVTGKQVALSNVDIVKIYDRLGKDVWYISYLMERVDEYSKEFEGKTNGGMMQIYSEKKGVIEKLLFLSDDFFCPEIYFTTTMSDIPNYYTVFDYKDTAPSFINIKYDENKVVKFSITRRYGVVIPVNFKNDDFIIKKIE